MYSPEDGVETRRKIGVDIRCANAFEKTLLQARQHAQEGELDEKQAQGQQPASAKLETAPPPGFDTRPRRRDVAGGQPFHIGNAHEAHEQPVTGEAPGHRQRLPPVAAGTGRRVGVTDGFQQDEQDVRQQYGLVGEINVLVPVERAGQQQLQCRRHGGQQGGRAPVKAQPAQHKQAQAAERHGNEAVVDEIPTHEAADRWRALADQTVGVGGQDETRWV